MDPKKPWLSKTLWINAIVAVAAIAYPPAAAYISAHPESVAIGFSIVNIVLRFVTKSEISIV